MFGLSRISGGLNVLETLTACRVLHGDSLYISGVFYISPDAYCSVLACAFWYTREKDSTVMLKILPTTLQCARASRCWQFFTPLICITSDVVFRLKNVESIRQHSVSVSKKLFHRVRLAIVKKEALRHPTDMRNNPIKLT